MSTMIKGMLEIPFADAKALIVRHDGEIILMIDFTHVLWLTGSREQRDILCLRSIGGARARRRRQEDCCYRHGRRI